MATTGNLIEWLAAGVRTTAGVAVASGKVRFYAPLTLVAQNIYSDAACSAVIAQPVTLSAGGTAVCYAANPVRMIVKDTLDTTTLFDVTENVKRAEQVYLTSPAFLGGVETTLGTILDAWTTTAGGSAGLWKYKRSGGTTERNLRDVIGEIEFSVKDFGATGDGVANDTTAVQATINAVVAAGGGIVKFPPGTYLITSALTVSSASGVSFKGAGAVSVIKQSGGAANALTITSCNNFAIQGLDIDHSSTSTGKAIALTSCQNVFIRDCRIGVNPAYVNALHMTASGIIVVDGCAISATGGTAVTLTGTQASLLNIHNSTISTDAASNCVEFAGTGTSAGRSSISETLFSGGAVGILFTSGTRYRVTSCYGLSGFAAVTTAFSAPTDPELYQIENGVDGYTVDVAIGGNHTPNRLRGSEIRIRASSGGAGTVTVNAPTPAPASSMRTIPLTIKFVNASGGAVTWAFAAATFVFVGAAVPASTDLHTITMQFLWDPDASRWRQVGDTLT